MKQIALMSCTNSGKRGEFALGCLRKARQRGLTLVELLIAMTLGLVILLAIGSIYLGSRATYRIQEDNARLQETGRYALEVLGRSVHQAGFWNVPISPISKATGFGGTAIAGTNGAAGAADTLTLQYDGLAGDRDCLGNTMAANAVVTDAYQLSGNELRCNGQALVADIENFQVLYGVDLGNDQSADRYYETPPDWSRVVSARVCVLARSPNSVNNAPQTYLNCEGALGRPNGGAPTTTAAAGDLRLRRVFVATLNLRNRITNLP